MRQTPVNNYLEEISTELPEELYGNLSDAIYETVCEFDEDVAQLKAENAKLRELCVDMYRCSDPCNDCPHYNGSSSDFYCRLGIGWKARRMRELGVEAGQ